MLVQFSVENFRSFYEETTFSMRATGDTRHDNHILPTRLKVGKFPGLLRTAAIFGANAAGKSNLVNAMAFAQALIVKGTRPNAAIAVEPFKLNGGGTLQPSRFGFIFVHDGILYSYGFAVDSTRVHEEWLFATPDKREVRLFERLTDSDGKSHFEFGPFLRSAVAQEVEAKGLLGGKTRLDNIASDTRSNQLLLTECAERNVESLAPVRKWFDQVLKIIQAEDQFEPLTVFSHIDSEFAGFLGEFLRSAGTGIERVETQSEPLDFDRHFSGVTTSEQTEIEETLSRLRPGEYAYWKGRRGRRCAVTRDKDSAIHFLSFHTIHKTKHGHELRFELEEESAGTQRLFDLLPALFMARMFTRVWILDEIDRCMHPLLSRLIVEASLMCPQDTTQSQFIFTTHDTNLLDLDLLRRDEIWYVENGGAAGSHLASLSEWKVRPDLEIGKSYLNGRFGAIPRFTDVQQLLCTPQATSGSGVSAHLPGRRKKAA